MHMQVPLRRRFLRFAAIAIASLGMASCGTRQPSTPGDASLPQDTSIRAWNPYVASDPGGRVYVSYFGGREGVDYGLYFTRSLDGGATWLPEPVNLETAQPQGKRIGFHKLETDGKGNVYAVWSIEHETGSKRWRTTEVRRRRSPDFGATWPEALTTWVPKGAINYPTSLTGVDGEMMMIWTGIEENTNGLFFSRTREGGTAWLPAPIRIDNHLPRPTPEERRVSRPPAWPMLARDKAGRLFVAWEEGDGDSTRIYFSRSLDQGVTWLMPAIRVVTSPKDASISRTPLITTDDLGGIYTAWEDFRNGRIEIFFNRSLDQGMTWFKQDLRLSPDRPDKEAAFLPQLSSDRQGRVYVLWKANWDAPESLYFISSVDRGTTWLLRPRRVDNHTQEVSSVGPRLAHDDDGHVYVVWGEERLKEKAILFNRSSDSGDTWLSQPIRLDTGGGKLGVRLPRMTIDAEGVIYVIWSSDRNGKPDLFLSRSKDHGTSWLPKELQVTR